MNKKQNLYEKIKIVNKFWGRFELYVNWYLLWTYIYWNDKKYLNPEMWAKKQIKKRKTVLERNILRLQKELKHFKEEFKALS